MCNCKNIVHPDKTENNLWWCTIIHSAEIDSPKDLRASDVTLETATLTWTPPLADIDGYILTYRDEGLMEVQSIDLSQYWHTHSLNET